MCNRECLEIDIFRVVWRGRSPSMTNPQQRHVRCEYNFCGAELAPREKKLIPYAFAAGESSRDERQRRGGARQVDVSPCRGLCSSPFAYRAARNRKRCGSREVISSVLSERRPAAPAPFPRGTGWCTGASRRLFCSSVPYACLPRRSCRRRSRGCGRHCARWTGGGQ